MLRRSRTFLRVSSSTSVSTDREPLRLQEGASAPGPPGHFRRTGALQSSRARSRRERPARRPEARARKPRSIPSACEDVSGRQRLARIDQHREQDGQSNRRSDALADAGHHAGAGERQTGTSDPVSSAAASMRSSERDKPFASASARIQAAASEEPPPSPAAVGSRLIKRNSPMRRLGMRAARASAARATRFRLRGPVSCAPGPSTVRLKRGPGEYPSQSESSAKATRLSRS